MELIKKSNGEVELIVSQSVINKPGRASPHTPSELESISDYQSTEGRVTPPNSTKGRAATPRSKTHNPMENEQMRAAVSVYNTQFMILV